MKRTLRDPGYLLDDEEYSTAEAYADPSLTDEIITWGQQEHNGKTLISAIGISEHYEPSDLLGLNVVEVSSDPKKGDTAEVKKRERSYEIFWQCSFCRRTSWVQVEDLEVKLGPNLDFQLTDTFEWIVSKRVLDVLEQAHINYRPLRNNQNYVQLVLPKPVTIVERWPVIMFDPCPECKRFMGFLRSNGTADGRLDLNNNGLQIKRDFSLWIHQPTSGNLAFAKGTEGFGRFEPLPDLPLNRLGEKVKGHAPIPWYFFFADAELVKDLLEIGVSGIDFRPVNVVSS